MVTLARTSLRHRPPVALLLLLLRHRLCHTCQPIQVSTPSAAPVSNRQLEIVPFLLLLSHRKSFGTQRQTPSFGFFLYSRFVLVYLASAPLSYQPRNHIDLLANPQGKSPSATVAYAASTIHHSLRFCMIPYQYTTNYSRSLHVLAWPGLASSRLDAAKPCSPPTGPRQVICLVLRQLPSVFIPRCAEPVFPCPQALSLQATPRPNQTSQPPVTVAGDAAVLVTALITTTSRASTRLPGTCLPGILASRYSCALTLMHVCLPGLSCILSLLPCASLVDPSLIHHLSRHLPHAGPLPGPLCGSLFPSHPLLCMHTSVPRP